MNKYKVQMVNQYSGSVEDECVDEMAFDSEDEAKEYAGYMEFGTGTKVQVPAEFSDMAKSFQSGGKGNFKQALENINLWCKKKGIDEKAAYPILLSILRVGVNPQPFFYPAWVATKKRYVKDLENLLKTLNKK